LICFFCVIWIRDWDCDWDFVLDVDSDLI